MDKLRQIAKAYYAGARKEDRESTLKFFQSFDKNGNGRISLEEFKEQRNELDPNGYYFKQIDENGDGTLDFDEFLTFFYLCKARLVECPGCNELQSGNYFSSMLCLGKISSDSYNLCCKCYAGAEFHHQHSSDNFLDLHAQHLLLCEIVKETKSEGVALRLANKLLKTGIETGVMTWFTLAIGSVGASATSSDCSMM